jgi:hypothetical protein
MNALFVDTSSEGLEMRDGVFGVANNIICLYSDVKISEVLDLLTRDIFDEVKKTHTAVQFWNPAHQNIQAGHTYLEIDSQFDQILNNREWTWEKILADAKETCGSSNKEGLTANKLQPKIVAQNFQVGF